MRQTGACGASPVHDRAQNTGGGPYGYVARTWELSRELSRGALQLGPDRGLLGVIDDNLLRIFVKTLFNCESQEESG